MRIADTPPMIRAAMAGGVILLIWGAIFLPTYNDLFHWDDLHLIRPYSCSELLSTFHGPNDPDRIETPALRPFATVLWAVQAFAFGENVVLHRIFMTALMGALLVVIAMFLVEIGLGTFQITVVFGLFISSRVFASLNLWLVMGSLVFSYIFMILAAYFFLRWMRHPRIAHLALMLICAAVAVFTREEAYTLPIVVLLISLFLEPSGRHWHRTLGAALALVAVVSVHIWLRHVFIPNAPTPAFTLASAGMVLTVFKASWLPCGATAVGLTDTRIQSLWIGFLLGLFFLFLCLSRPRVLCLFLGACCTGTLLCSPALAVARPFGTAMPTVAFMTAISIAIPEVYHQIRHVRPGARWRQFAFVLAVILGLATGIAGGFRRSINVAESLHENCAIRLIRDAEFIFGIPNNPTIPEKRRWGGAARLAVAGIKSVADLRHLQKDLRENPAAYERNRISRKAPFLPKYEYLSF